MVAVGMSLGAVAAVSTTLPMGRSLRRRRFLRMWVRLGQNHRGGHPAFLGLRRSTQCGHTSGTETTVKVKLT